MFNRIYQIVVPGALNDTKKIRKAGADIFAAGMLECQKTEMLECWNDQMSKMSKMSKYQKCQQCQKYQKCGNTIINSN
jgi:hypothetical protein